MRYIPLYWQERKSLSRLERLGDMWLTRLELINFPYLERKREGGGKNLEREVHLPDLEHGSDPKRKKDISKGVSLNRLNQYLMACKGKEGKRLKVKSPVKRSNVVISQVGFLGTASIMLCPWNCSRQGWMGLWEICSRGRCPCPWQWGWNWVVWKILLNSNHSMILCLVEDTDDKFFPVWQDKNQVIWRYF